jgi:PleD family two-component response regulator
VADEYPAAGSEARPGTEFKAQVLQLFITHSAAAMQAITALATAFVTDEGSSEQLTQLNELFHKVHSITANAAIAGCVAVAHFASTFEAFLKELQHKAKFINPSTLRTVANSVNFLAVLLDQAAQPAPAAAPPPSILVVDADPVSAQTVELALAKADLPITTLENPNDVLRVLGETRYDLVVIAIDLAGSNGIELYTRMRTLTNHANTPVLLISTLNELDNHISLITGAETDIIARPFLLMELTVKAVMQLQRAQMLQ